VEPGCREPVRLPPVSGSGRNLMGSAAGLDVFGNRYCGPLCPLLAMVRNHQALHRCEVAFHNAAGGLTPAQVSMFAIPGQGGSASLIVHLLSARVADAEHPALSDGHWQRPHLERIPRKREVLMNLAQGKATPPSPRSWG
jgi:hypothetical protein